MYSIHQTLAYRPVYLQFGIGPLVGSEIQTPPRYGIMAVTRGGPVSYCKRRKS